MKLHAGRRPRASEILIWVTLFTPSCASMSDAPAKAPRLARDLCELSSLLLSAPEFAPLRLACAAAVPKPEEIEETFDRCISDYAARVRAP